MKNIFIKARTFAITHKKTSVAIGVVFLIVLYFVYKALTSTTGETTYTLGSVERGTIVSSITGSGQVSVDRTLEVKPEGSGNIVYVGVKEGQTVRAGDLIAQLDASDALKNVRDAEANLASAQISYQKALLPADTLTVLQAENNLAQAKADLEKAYNDGYNNISDAFIDLPTVVSGIDAVLHNTDANTSTSGQQNSAYYGDTAAQFESAANFGKAQKYKADAEAKYTIAKAAYDKNFSDYKETSRVSSSDAISALTNETYTTAQLVADAVQSAQNLIQYYQDVLVTGSRTAIPKSNTHLASLTGFTGKVNGVISDLLNTKTAIVNGMRSIPEKQASLDKIKSGLDALDRESAELSLQRSKNALADARETLSNYYVRAPFAGTIAKVSMRKGDVASSGTAVATLVANEQVVDIPLNEVDVSKVKTGNKVTFTFDAVDSLTLTGKVASVDTVGTVSQGVVNYTVTMNFDTADERIKPGMSVTASIITDVHQDVLIVPSSAVKNSASGTYVQIFAAADPEAPSVVSKIAPEQVPVTVGISDDANTEIISGLTEGQRIVTKSIAVSSTAKTTAAPSLLGGGVRSGTTVRAGGVAR